MATYTILPIAAPALEELRRGVDDAGRPIRAYEARDDGEPIACVGSPLRCCLRKIEPGERVALVAYAPLRRWALATGADPGGYDETGPVFIHADQCAPERTDVYPFARPGALRTLRRYNTNGHIVGGSAFEIPADAQAGFERALGHAFSDPDVELVHVRALEYGCFLFEVRSP